MLLICDVQGLIGRDMFAIDGCKMPGNASKAWSGTKAELTAKKRKLERAVRRILEAHRTRDGREVTAEVAEQERQYIDTLKRQVRKLKAWLDDHDDKPGKGDKPRTSNITDNDSAKMKTSHGVVQGYDGVAAVDDRCQIVVHAETVFHTERNLEYLYGQGIDGYVADNLMRKRDPRFQGIDKYKARHRGERRTLTGARQLFTNKDFRYDPEAGTCVCPAGQSLYSNGSNVFFNGYAAVKFRAPKSACGPCELRSQCLRYPERTASRQVAFFSGQTRKPESFTQRMKRKIDSALGKAIYHRRVGTVEPVFGHLNTIGLKRFTLRGRTKVDAQWKLYCMVHNLLKIHRYGAQFGQ